jgi:hypothetical protein
MSLNGERDPTERDLNMKIAECAVAIALNPKDSRPQKNVELDSLSEKLPGDP